MSRVVATLVLLLATPVAASAQQQAGAPSSDPGPEPSGVDGTAAPAADEEASPAEPTPGDEADADTAPGPEPAPAEASPAEPSPAEPSPAEPSPEPAPRGTGPERTWMQVSLGFSHWYGGTFGAPVGTYTPGLIVGVIPHEVIELQLAYTVSVVTLPLPDASESHVGFLTLALMLRSELRVAGERLVLAGGVVGGMVHTHNGVRGVLGGAVAGRYLIGVDDVLAIGPFLDVRALLYELPSSPLPIYELRDGELIAGHSDAHVQIGVAAAF